METTVGKFDDAAFLEGKDRLPTGDICQSDPAVGFYAYLPSIKAKLANLTVWYRELRGANMRLSARVMALEQKVDKKRCPRCGGEVW